MTDCFSQPGLLPFERAKALIIENLPSISQQEEVSIALAVGRIVAQQVHSPVNVPPHDNSAMDGYAFAQASVEQHHTLTLAGTAFAGAPYQGKVELGQAVRIMTGGKVPAGCDTVEMQENVELSRDEKSGVEQSGSVQPPQEQSLQKQASHITLKQSTRQGQHIRRCGEDIAVNQVLFAQGHQLTSADIGTLASIGVAKIAVFKPLTIALIATGDELKQPGEPLGDGDIFESNRYFLNAMLGKLPVKLIDFGVIPDDKEKLRAAFNEADLTADIIISSGGVSVGEADYTKEILQELGQIGFWKIAMKPGKPFAFGKLANSTFFGLPGNPVSALVTCYQLVVPALYKMMQADLPSRVQLPAKVATTLKKSPGRMDFQRGIWRLNDNGEVEVESTGAQGSGILTSIAKANCFILLAQDQGRVEQGETVTIELFDHLIS
ncbi:molybdopterin molybdenumtransferase MoeA [Thalassotalea euphylliae]|uniref:Molybdopterin molybdenumtransferase n=1 Tax=Thalassotalea euphylliae TaxID=1655234 RepID=A0A3E0TMM4_9GAMM|nr:gephyrin-like molybdotransferase Glp [Thalassotalea euphylliae]REL25804.1 molybdopterin molybdenumtransferase MoeA [Thalassotalea euphylliae]